ncbi:MAG: hypothetical protein FJ167_09900 [Gammaproteobacteria bacterium]|nr:hypothetical protein [Gammaproteobacteria bacterium]
MRRAPLIGPYSTPQQVSGFITLTDSQQKIATGIYLPSFGGNQSANDLYTVMQGMTSKAPATPQFGGTLTLNSVLIGNYDYTIKSTSQTVSSFTSTDWFTSTADSNAALIFINGDLTINSGQTFTPSVRKLFTCIYVKGNLTVAGAISMTARGANTNFLSVQTANIRIINGTYSSVTNPQIPSSGGAGGAGGTAINTNVAGSVGNNGSAGGTGGGGGGSAYWAIGGNGSAGSSFSGGGGGGGQNGGTNTSLGDSNAQTFGGTGGVGRNSPGGNNSTGGTGNPGGSSINTNNVTNGSAFFGTDGTGGTLVIFCTGLLLGAGTISSNGTNGVVNAGAIGGGGASGGGSITILCNSNSSSITRSVSGGTAGTVFPTAPYNAIGGNGGSGSERVLTGL